MVGFLSVFHELTYENLNIELCYVGLEIFFCKVLRIGKFYLIRLAYYDCFPTLFLFTMVVHSYGRI